MKLCYQSEKKEFWLVMKIQVLKISGTIGHKRIHKWSIIIWHISLLRKHLSNFKCEVENMLYIKTNKCWAFRLNLFSIVYLSARFTNLITYWFLKANKIRHQSEKAKTSCIILNKNTSTREMNFPTFQCQRMQKSIAKFWKS